MSHLQAILESEETVKLLEENKDLVAAGITESANFLERVRLYIFDNIQEFIEPSLDDTLKNIKVFTEGATSQYFSEMTYINSGLIKENEEPVDVNPMDEYL